MPDFIVEMLNITKSFSSLVANDAVTLKLKKGEIHALLGENGAGKSTLVSILFGLYQADKGIIKKNGMPVKINSPIDARKLGIGMVHQHFKLIHNFTVLENIILGMETVKSGFLKLDEARERVIKLSKHYKLEIDPDSYIADISIGMQQRVEILKMLYRENEILIFDEPTAVLTPQEIEELLNIMKQLAAEGKSILFITHKLNEIKAIADACTVLRKGKCIGTVDVTSVSKEELSEMMVGRKVQFSIEKKESMPGESILKVKNLTVNSNLHSKAVVNDVSFDVRLGEIVCIAGIEGNGQQELISAITGLIPSDSGSIFLEEKNITHNDIRSRKLAHVPEDRHKHALVLDYNLAYNLVLRNYYMDRFKKNGFLKYNEIYNYADQLIKNFDIRAGSGSKTVTRNMSGGNQQKAIVAREISLDARLFIAVQPTRGLDAGACEYIHKKLLEERDKGRGVLIVSLELDEVMEISDRILVMYEGKIVANVKPNEVDFKQLGLYMAGSI